MRAEVRPQEGIDSQRTRRQRAIHSDGVFREKPLTKLIIIIGAAWFPRIQGTLSSASSRKPMCSEKVAPNHEIW